MRRPDSGTRNNMVMEMAASIIHSKMLFLQLVLEQHKAKPQEERDEGYELRLQEDLIALNSAVNTIDEKMGCWS